MPVSAFEGKNYIRDVLAKIHQTIPIKSVLDIGVGAGTYSNLFRASYPGKWIGVEIWEPYIEKYQLIKKYDEIHVGDARQMEFPEADYPTYNVCFLGDILEHMTPQEAIALYNKGLDAAEFVFISIPIILYPQKTVEGNPYETHIAPDWTHDKVVSTFCHIKSWYHGRVVGVYVGSKWHNLDIPKCERSGLFRRLFKLF